jgi:hypothetical protein
MQGDPTEIPRERLRRPEAAVYCARRLGQSVKVNTLRTWSIAYRQVGRDAVYEIVDLDRFIDERLKAAPRRRPPAGQQPRKPLAALEPLIDQQETAIERAPEPRAWVRE